MIVGCVVVALIVVFFAVMVIYNIFQVGLIQKIQEYGKIKALGATKKTDEKAGIPGRDAALPSSAFRQD